MTTIEKIVVFTIICILGFWIYVVSIGLSYISQNSNQGLKGLVDKVRNGK